MSYVANSLAPHERLVVEARFPWLLHAAAWAALVLLTLVPCLGWAGLALAGRAGAVLGALAVLSGVGGLVIFVALYLYMTFTETGVTDQRLVLKRGIVARHATDFPLPALENVDVNQSVFSRLFGYGHLVIAGAGDTTLRTPPMQDPVSFRTALSEARIALSAAPTYRARPVRTDPMSGPNDRTLDGRARRAHLGERGARPAAPTRRQ